MTYVRLPGQARIALEPSMSTPCGVNEELELCRTRGWSGEGGSVLQLCSMASLKPVLESKQQRLGLELCLWSLCSHAYSH